MRTPSLLELQLARMINPQLENDVDGVFVAHDEIWLGREWTWYTRNGVPYKYVVKETP
jgi:hypothetical protein